MHAATQRLTALRPAQVSRPRHCLSLAETIDILYRRRLVLVETSRGLRIRHGHYHTTPALELALEAYAPALRVWLQLGGLDFSSSCAWKTQWDHAVQLFAGWLIGLRTPPPCPIPLRDGVSITDWEQYKTSVFERLTLGPGSPYAEDLEAELTLLFTRLAIALPVRSVLHRLSKAA